MEHFVNNAAYQNRPKWKRWRVISITCGIVCLAVGGLLVLPVIRTAEHFIQKVRYTSICSRCGEQSTAEFNIVFGTELLRREKILPVSQKTALHNPPAERCNHDSVLIGKSIFGISKDLKIFRMSAGEPGGSEFANIDLKPTLQKLAAMRPAESLGYMQGLQRMTKVEPQALQRAEAPAR